MRSMDEYHWAQDKIDDVCNGNKKHREEAACERRLRQKGKVEVWATDGEYCFGVLPEAATADDVAHAVRFHQGGFRLGERVGKASVREEIRSALGL